MISLFWNRCYFYLFPSSRENGSGKRAIDDVSRTGDKITDSPSLITRVEIVMRIRITFSLLIMQFQTVLEFSYNL